MRTLLPLLLCAFLGCTHIPSNVVSSDRYYLAHGPWQSSSPVLIADPPLVQEAKMVRFLQDGTYQTVEFQLRKTSATSARPNPGRPPTVYEGSWRIDGSEIMLTGKEVLMIFGQVGPFGVKYGSAGESPFLLKTANCDSQSECYRRTTDPQLIEYFEKWVALAYQAREKELK